MAEDAANSVTAVEAADPVMCGKIVAGDDTMYKCTVDNAAAVAKAASDAADAAALARANVVAELKTKLCATATADDACPAPEAPEATEGDGEDKENKEDSTDDDKDSTEGTDTDKKDKKCDCPDEDADLSVGHSVSVLSGVLALASALF